MERVPQPLAHKPWPPGHAAAREPSLFRDIESMGLLPQPQGVMESGPWHRKTTSPGLPATRQLVSHHSLGTSNRWGSLRSPKVSWNRAHGTTGSAQAHGTTGSAQAQASRPCGSLRRITLQRYQRGSLRSPVLSWNVFHGHSRTSPGLPATRKLVSHHSLGTSNRWGSLRSPKVSWNRAHGTTGSAQAQASRPWGSL